MTTRDPFLLALLGSGHAELISNAPTPATARPPDPPPKIPAWKTSPTREELDWEKTLPPSSGDYRNPLDRTAPAPSRACSQQFIDLYTDGAGHCFSDADEGL